MNMSERNIPLIYQGTGVPRSVLTFENYEKWYNIYMVQQGMVFSVAYKLVQEAQEDCQKDGCQHDLIMSHCWHPVLLEKLAKNLNADVDFVSMDVCIGRWWLEGLGKEVDVL